MKLTIVNVVIIVSLALMLAGCAKPSGYGKAIDMTEITKIADILANPADFEGKEVLLSGKILTECPTGCWFVLGYDQVQIYVDLGPFGFALPQHVGATALAQGKIKKSPQGVMLIGEGVTIK